MKNIKDFNKSDWPKIEFLFTDIDDTLTNDGLLYPEAYESLWQLHRAGLHVVPVTGRPAGWCEMIARQWPVSGVIGENGGFYFRYHKSKMHRWYAIPLEERLKNQDKLSLIQKQVLSDIPQAAVASDQFCRQLDLAIDFCEDVPKLDPHQVQKIVTIFKDHGATAKVSSIHVNGWFGKYNKVTTVFEFTKNEFNLSESETLMKSTFVGDSPNDEPLFENFRLSFGVANILNFKDSLKTTPTYYSNLAGGQGFQEISKALLD